MNRLSELLSQHIGIELWVASLVAIALITVVANQVAQVLLRQAARVTEKTSTVWKLSSTSLLDSRAQPEEVGASTVVVNDAVLRVNALSAPRELAAPSAARPKGPAEPASLCRRR